MVNPSNNNSNIKEKRIWDWDKIAQNNANDDYDSVICIGGETALNQYINRTHQKNIWKYASSLNVKNLQRSVYVLNEAIELPGLLQCTGKSSDQQQG